MLRVRGARGSYAAPLAHADGVLICPTNAGALVALDLVTRELLWAHAYRKEKPPPVVQEAPPPWRGPRRRFPRPPPARPLPDKRQRAAAPVHPPRHGLFPTPRD